MDLKPVVFLYWFSLPSLVIANIPWIDGQCGPCQCNSRIEQFKVELSVSCSNRNLTEIPDNLPTGIHILDLSYNFLGKSDLKNLNLYGDVLETLSLAHNDIRQIDKKVILSVKNLQELDLSGNILDYVSEKLFYPLNLRILRGLGAMSFHRNSFRRFGSMEDLTAVFVQESIPKDIFQNLFVSTLDVTFRRAKHIPAGLFGFGSNSLITLSINGPSLLSLSGDTFKDLTLLKTLTIDGSNIRELPSNLFYRSSTDSMPIHLYKIRIIGVKTLPRDLLIGQKSLKFASFQNIEDIPPLKLPKQLDSLDLSGSNVHTFYTNMFAELSNLRELNLTKTSLTSLEKNVFGGLSSLFDLDMSKNQITDLPEGIFEACRNTLEYITLSYNKLQRITEFYFTSVKSLRVLNLSYNQITHIEEKSFRNLSVLSVLYLVGNFISHLPANLFFGVQSLQVIDLTKNNISKLPANIFSGYKLETVKLSNNPIDCDCNLILMKMDNRFVHFYGTCNSPTKYNGVRIMSLKSDESCRFSTTQRQIILSSTTVETTSKQFINTFSQKATPPLSTLINIPVTSMNCTTLYNNLNSTQLDASPCSVGDLKSVSVFYESGPHPENTSTVQWDFILLYICASIIAIVLIVLSVVSGKEIFERYRRSGTYILPPPLKVKQFNEAYSA